MLIGTSSVFSPAKILMRTLIMQVAHCFQMATSTRVVATNITPSFGVARSTLANDKAALNLWVAFRKECESPEKITLHKKNWMRMVLRASSWNCVDGLHQEQTHYNFDENLECPSNIKCNRLLQKHTCKTYWYDHQISPKSVPRSPRLEGPAK